jgi:tRNA (mo5U34)-methyltransferase
MPENTSAAARPEAAAAAAERPLRPDIGWIARSAAEYQLRLDAIKQTVQPRDFNWYPYDSIGSLFTLDEVLTGESRYLLEVLDSGPVLDLGCADGELSFFLESQGCEVHAIDQPITNYNRMKGVRALKSALNSSIEIHEADLDSYFKLPRARYQAAFVFGILYHLKNPFYVLETLSRHSRYCFLTTRIARFAPDRKTALLEVPVGYLVDRTETNDDPTNYWIFSEPGLLRLLERTGWIVRDFRTFGNTSDSDPASWEGDERAFCFAERRIVDRVTTARLLSGWHDLEEEGAWRWTERKFSALITPSEQPQGRLLLKLTIPESHIRTLGPMTITVNVNGTAGPAITFEAPGPHSYSMPIPTATGAKLLVEGELDRALPPRAGDPRELGVIVSRLEVVQATSESEASRD